jgi:ribosomal protein S18 acetylase RimI-like enzyme
MIKKLLQADLNTSAKIHFEGMSNDFLPGFGLKFLEILHRQLILQPQVIHLGYYDNNHLIGLILATTNTKVTMKKALIGGFWKFLPYVFIKIIISPKTILNIWQTIFYGNSSDEISSEILILAVDKQYRRKGIGNKLISQLKIELVKNNIKKLKVGTLSSNVPANKFYASCGGKFSYSFNIYNRVWNVYAYKLS